MIVSEIWGHLTYFSLSLRSFRISHKYLQTDTREPARSASVRFRLSHESLFVNKNNGGASPTLRFWLFVMYFPGKWEGENTGIRD